MKKINIYRYWFLLVGLLVLSYSSFSQGDKQEEKKSKLEKERLEREKKSVEKTEREKKIKNLFHRCRSSACQTCNK